MVQSSEVLCVSSKARALNIISTILQGLGFDNIYSHKRRIVTMFLSLEIRMGMDSVR